MKTFNDVEINEVVNLDDYKNLMYKRARVEKINLECARESVKEITIDKIKQLLTTSKLNTIPKTELIDKGEFFETRNFNIYTFELLQTILNKVRLL